jgi:hypothetical protein
VRTPLLLALALILSACSQDKPPAPPALAARAVVEGFDISVQTVSTHPMLNEHQERIDIRKDAKPVASLTLTDPGGFSTVYVIDDGRRLLVIDGLDNGVAIDKTSLQAGDFDPKSIPHDAPAKGLGRFAFAGEPTTWQWIAVGMKQP